MRILQVTNGYPPDAHGGVETYTQTISESLARRGHALEVLCRISAREAPEYQLRLDSVNGLPVRRVVNDLSDAARFEAHYRNPRFTPHFNQHLDDFQPEVVHFQHCLGLSAAMIGEAAARRLPIIVSLHDFWYFCPRATLFDAGQAICPGPRAQVDCVRCLGGARLGLLNIFQRGSLYKRLLHRLPRRAQVGLRLLLERRPVVQSRPDQRQQQRHRQLMDARTTYLLGCLRQADQLLTPSEFVRSAYAGQGLEAGRIEVLPLGIDPPAPAPGPARAGGFVIAYIGTLQYHKGPDVLIQAYRAAGHLPGELRLYGRGDTLDAYGDNLRAAAAGDARIRFMGGFARAELAAILAEIDVLVLPSRTYETYSLAAREALLAGVPVIASNLGALPEVIRDGHNGALTPAGDAAALATALATTLARLPALRAGALATPAAPTVAEHVDRLEQRYQRLAARS